MISFNTNSVFNLKPIPITEARQEVGLLLTEGEAVVAAFRTVRDQLIFTNKRIISVDVIGITGTKKSFSTLPYSRIKFFEIQTPSIAELIRDSELILWFASGTKVSFEFKGDTDIFKISRMISSNML